jgi:hypothetical protein
MRAWALVNWYPLKISELFRIATYIFLTRRFRFVITPPKRCIPFLVLHHACMPFPVSFWVLTFWLVVLHLWYFLCHGLPFRKIRQYFVYVYYHSISSDVNPVDLEETEWLALGSCLVGAGLTNVSRWVGLDSFFSYSLISICKPDAFYIERAANGKSGSGSYRSGIPSWHHIHVKSCWKHLRHFSWKLKYSISVGTVKH